MNQAVARLQDHRELTEPSETQLVELSPSELLPDDLVLVNANWARVIDEAMTMHRGLGMFDDFQLLVGARIEFAGQPGARVWTWKPADRVQVRRGAGLTLPAAG
jgi:hypothetical protein